jgi:hypothetical protein
LVPNDEASDCDGTHTSKPNEIEVKWLLNLEYMSLGKYSPDTPPTYLFPSSAFESKEEVVRFVYVARLAGINPFSISGGIIVDDLEGILGSWAALYTGEQLIGPSTVPVQRNVLCLWWSTCYPHESSLKSVHREHEVTGASVLIA